MKFTPFSSAAPLSRQAGARIACVAAVSVAAQSSANRR
jgi:hypothetical protein